MTTQRDSLELLGRVRRPGTEPFRCRWPEFIAELKAYRKTNGHMSVPVAYHSPSGFELGKWVFLVGYGLNWPDLAAKRRSQLVSLGFGINFREPTYSHMLRHAAAYARSHGALRKVPRTLVMSDGCKLGMAVTDWRRAWAEGRLDEQTTSDLTALGLAAPVPAEQSFTHLVENELDPFIAEFGHPNPSAGYVTKSGFHLGAWMYQVRKRALSDDLDPDNAEMLVDRGVVFGQRAPALEVEFKRKLEIVVSEIALLGSEPSADYVSAEGERVGRWLVHWRQRFLEGHLKPGRVALLRQAGVRLEPVRSARARYVDADSGEIARRIVEFRRAFRHGWICRSYETSDGFPLGAVAVRLRNAYSERLMSAQEVALYEAAGMVWECPEEFFESTRGVDKTLRRFLDHVADYDGDLDALGRHWAAEDGYRLGEHWFGLRLKWREGEISPAKAKALSEAGLNCGPRDSQRGRH